MLHDHVPPACMLRQAFFGMLLALCFIAVMPLWANSPPSNFPPPTEWAATSGAPGAPGDAFNVTFGNATPPANAPVISGWSPTALPNETFTLTGKLLTNLTGAQAGSDTTVWLWADDAGAARSISAKPGSWKAVRC